MRRLWNTFLKGLVAVLPVTLTVYLVFWLGSTAERILSGPLRALLPEDRYWPGLGLLVGFLLVLLVGVMVNAYVVRYLLRIGESFLARIPIVKTIFGAFKDITQFLPAGGKARDLKRVVLWRFGSAQLIGFVTEEHVSTRLFGDNADRTGRRVLPDELPDRRLHAVPAGYRAHAKRICRCRKRCAWC